jgi:predicted MFS family arabinose efflux permease
MWLIQRLSPRVLILIGGTCAAGGLLLIGLAGSGYVLAVAVFLASMSAGWIWTATPAAVRQLQPEDQQDRVLSWSNSGTGLGVLIAAPVLLLLAAWRDAYVAYALLALIVTGWAWVALPALSGASASYRIELDWRGFICMQSLPLLLMAIATGIVAAIYWTFAVDLIVASGLTAPWIRQAFWFVSGGAGIFGLIVSGAIQRYGIRRVLPVNMIVLALGLGLPAIAPSHIVPVMISAVFFGVGFIMITGLLAIWSVHIFAEKPSAGLGAVLILVAVGQVIGPAIAGLIAESVGLIPVFVGGVIIALVSMVLRPRPSDDVESDRDAQPIS